MDQPVAFYRSSIGKKVLMAVTGLFLLLFLIGHVVGNLKAFMGPEHFNEYAEFLRRVGEPALPHKVFLWIFRILLIVSLAVHVIAAIQVWLRDRRARPVGYRRYQSLAISQMSRTMFWGGLTIFAYVIYHLLHFTIGTVHPDFIPGDAYHNLVTGLQNPIVAAVYVLAMIPLGMHLYHGFWSSFNTLGSRSPRWNRARRPLAAAIALIIILGFVSVPVAVQLGILRIGG